MNDVGRLLQSKREAMGLSLAYVAAVLKIREKYLNGIEKWDFSDLPPKVYVIGYLKTYANFVGLDGNEISKKFKDVYEDGLELSMPQVMCDNSTPNLSVVIIAVCVSMLIYNYWSNSESGKSSAENISNVMLSKFVGNKN